MRIVTFNIRHAESARGEVDVEGLCQACAGLEADVLGLQEVDVGAGRSHRADLAAEAAEASGMAVAFGPAINLRDGGRYGNALLVRGSISDVEVVPLTPRPEAEARAALLATATVGGVALSVAVCHLGLDRREASDQLATVIEAMGARPRPRVLLGDWNLRRWRVAQPVRRAGYRLVRGGLTFPARFPVRRIDHVAVDGLRPTWRARTARTPVSDHRPLLAEFSAPASWPA